jgi:hypothetical protein
MRRSHVIGLSLAVVAAGAFLAAVVALSVDGDEVQAAGGSLVGSTAIGAARKKAPSPEERRIIEDANIVLDAVDGATFQVIAELLERGTGGAVQALGTTLELDEIQGIEFASDVQLWIDLDETDDDGVDMYPKASGIMLVQAKGTLTGNEYAGMGIYNVSMTRQTSIVYRDERNRRTLDAPQGPGLQFHVAIAWDVEDPDEWTVSWASEAARAGLPLTLTTQGRDYHAVLSGELYEAGMIGMEDGESLLRSNVSGFRQVVLADREGQNTVRIDVENAERAVLSVNDNRFGPHTVRELDREYGTQIGHLLEPESETPKTDR